MTREPAEFYQVFALCALLSCVASWIIAHRYRRRMQWLMRAPSPEGSRSSNAPAADAPADRTAEGAAVSLADNRAAGMRLTMLLIASSCLLAGTSACIFSALMFPADPLMLWRVIPIAVLHLWPVIPAIALMWRWSRAHFFGALLLWCAATCVVLFVIGLWRQSDMGPLLLFRSWRARSVCLWRCCRSCSWGKPPAQSPRGCSYRPHCWPGRRSPAYRRCCSSASGSRLC